MDSSIEKPRGLMHVKPPSSPIAAKRFDSQSGEPLVSQKRHLRNGGPSQCAPIPPLPVHSKKTYTASGGRHVSMESTNTAAMCNGLTHSLQRRHYEDEYAQSTVAQVLSPRRSSILSPRQRRITSLKDPVQPHGEASNAQLLTRLRTGSGGPGAGQAVGYHGPLVSGAFRVDVLLGTDNNGLIYGTDTEHSPLNALAPSSHKHRRGRGMGLRHGTEHRPDIDWRDGGAMPPGDDALPFEHSTRGFEGMLRQGDDAGTGAGAAEAEAAAMAAAAAAAASGNRWQGDLRQLAKARRHEERRRQHTQRQAAREVRRRRRKAEAAEAAAEAEAGAAAAGNRDGGRRRGGGSREGARGGRERGQERRSGDKGSDGKSGGSRDKQQRSSGRGGGEAEPGPPALAAAAAPTVAAAGGGEAGGGDAGRESSSLPCSPMKSSRRRDAEPAERGGGEQGSGSGGTRGSGRGGGSASGSGGGDGSGNGSGGSGGRISGGSGRVQPVPPPQGSSRKAGGQGGGSGSKPASRGGRSVKKSSKKSSGGGSSKGSSKARRQP